MPAPHVANQVDRHDQRHGQHNNAKEQTDDVEYRIRFVFLSDFAGEFDKFRSNVRRQNAAVQTGFASWNGGVNAHIYAVSRAFDRARTDAHERVAEVAAVFGQSNNLRTRFGFVFDVVRRGCQRELVAFFRERRAGGAFDNGKTVVVQNEVVQIDVERIGVHGNAAGVERAAKFVVVKRNAAVAFRLVEVDAAAFSVERNVAHNVGFSQNEVVFADVQNVSCILRNAGRRIERGVDVQRRAVHDV